MSKPVPVRYRTTNWSEYNASLRRRDSLPVWLDREMEWLAPASHCPGRPQTFSDAAIQLCLSLKVLFGLALRRTMGMVASLLKMAGLEDWPVPDFSPLCRRPRTVTIQIPFRRSSGNLNLLIDSTGVKVRGAGEWRARKHGASRRRQWRKVHLARDATTGDIRAVEFTSSQTGDSPVLPDLLAQIPSEQPIGTVTADGAYDTRKCHSVIADRGGTSIIPIRRNGRAWHEDCPAASARNETLQATQRFGRALWKRLTGYHAEAGSSLRCAASRASEIVSPPGSQPPSRRDPHPHRPDEPLPSPGAGLRLPASPEHKEKRVNSASARVTQQRSFVKPVVD